LIVDKEMKPVSPKTLIECSSAEHVYGGIPIPKPLRVTTFSPAEWESFTQEWLTSLKDSYASVERHSGSGDQGIDVAGFIEDSRWESGWDNYQCKHYDHPLNPSDVWVEIGKIVYYSYKQEYPPPRKYYFIASRDIGTKLGKLLKTTEKLKEEAKINWEKYCQKQITATTSIHLEGDLLDWFEAFDFSIFSTKSVVDLIDGHSKTPYHAVRFGGGLPPRPVPISPPQELETEESHYIQQIFNAYSDNMGTHVNDVSGLSSSLRRDFLRQRERFYHAESLRNFARDTVPEGTFENLQNEIFHGVIDVCDCSHGDGLARMKATVAQAANISPTSNPLKSVVGVQDRQGICHQLANENRLIWVPMEEET
jgi:hypothetical protein